MALAIVPTYLRDLRDVLVTVRCLRTLRETAPELDVLVVDDGSPDSAAIERLQSEVEAIGLVQLELRPENEGFARTVNVGLRRARDEGRDALLVNADIEFIDDAWLQRMADVDALVVGGRLLYPNRLIQHAGIFFSLLHRTFGHIYHFAPHNLPEAQHPRVCPVTGALQLIRHEALELVGVYDDDFRMGFEDVDYSVRVFQAGERCIYEPTVRAIHHESLFRGRSSPKLLAWQAESWRTFKVKHATDNFAQWVPSLV